MDFLPKHLTIHVVPLERVGTSDGKGETITKLDKQYVGKLLAILVLKI